MTHAFPTRRASDLAGPANRLDWLAGDWCSEADGRRIEEIWLPEAGGMLQGMARTVRDAEVESFEFMRIVSDGGATSFHAQPNGAPPTVFTMVASGEGRSEEHTYELQSLMRISYAVF